MRLVRARQSRIRTWGKAIDLWKGREVATRTFRREMPRHILGHQLIDLLHRVLALEAGLRQAGLFVPNRQCERVWRSPPVNERAKQQKRTLPC